MARRGVEFELIGLSDLKQSLDTLSTSVREKLADALDDTANAVKYQARVNVPRDKGDLARAIQIGGKGLSLKVGLDDSPVPSRGGKNAAHLHPWVYGLFVEFGLKSREMEAHAFMGPAVDQEQPSHDQRIEKALNDAVGSV